MNPATKPDAPGDGQATTARGPERDPRADSASPAPSGLLSALPTGLRLDPLYLRASHALRRRPWKILLWLVLLGLFCWQGQELGSRHLAPPLRNAVRGVTHPQLRSVLYSLSGAIFSSLNLLSCLGIVILAATLRGLISRSAISELRLTLRPMRPSSLYYALAPRYLPLAFISMLPLFLKPGASVFDTHPFVTMSGPAAWNGAAGVHQRPVRLEELPTDDPRVFRIAALYLISLGFFCGANLMMDLALGFWLFARRGPGTAMVLLAVTAVGVVTPVLLMAFRTWLDQRVGEVFRSENRLWRLYSMEHYSASLHYAITGAGSLALTWVLLADLNRRWFRTLRNPAADPVMFGA